MLYVPDATSDVTPSSDGNCEPALTLTFTETNRKSKEQVKEIRRRFKIIDEYVTSVNPGIKDIQ